MGDLYTLFCAIGFAIYIIIIDSIKSEEFLSIVLLHFFVIVICSLILIQYESLNLLEFNFNVYFSVLYLSIPATLITTLILFYYQPQTTPVKASILYAMEPVFATIFSIIFLNIIYTIQDFIGSVLIFIGSIFGALFKKTK
ncbi:MAG: hypothetical protein KatS3mg129_2197 [Leptospiraceae bacterium]|nr:MAG: hypothetical protein KatS3mg129_2197 [Leptospiraceae bacterium]